MKSYKKITIFILLAVFLIVSGCATAPKQTGYSHSDQIKYEKETQAFFIRAIASVVGAIGGGAIGVLSAEQDTAITMGLTGLVLGGAAGFGLGYVISENMAKEGDDFKKPSDKKVEEYWKEYEYLKLKQ